MKLPLMGSIALLLVLSQSLLTGCSGSDAQTISQSSSNVVTDFQNVLSQISFRPSIPTYMPFVVTDKYAIISSFGGYQQVQLTFRNKNTGEYVLLRESDEPLIQQMYTDQVKLHNGTLARFLAYAPKGVAKQFAWYWNRNGITYSLSMHVNNLPKMSSRPPETDDLLKITDSMN